MCIFYEWVKTFPTRMEQSQDVAKVLLWEIMLWFSLPLTIHSNSGPAFVADIVQVLAKSLNITWRFHTAYQPQSSGKVKRINHNPKETLEKFCQKTNLSWPDLLPLALLCAHCTPRMLGYSPFELVYGQPPHAWGAFQKT